VHGKYLLRYGLGYAAGLSSLGKPGIKVFPDPARDMITLEFPVEIESNGMLAVYGPVGQVLIRKQAGGYRLTLDVSALPAGLYFVKVSNEESNYLGKFFKAD
jgi:hypothetical protein